jgi:uncharacterized protein (DUF4415 family)
MADQNEIETTEVELPAVEETTGLAELAQEEQQQATPEAKKPREIRVSATVTLDQEVLSELKADEKGLDPIYALRMPLDELDEAVADYPNINPRKGAEGRNWSDTVENALPLVLRGSVLLSSLKRDGSNWRQSVEHEGVNLRIGRPALGASNDPTQRLTGERAIMKIQGALGLGSVVQVPLWHSGIWVTIKAPSDGAMLNLERIIAEEKISLGRDSTGMIFSNASVYINNHLFNFILEHIYETTLKDYTPEKLRMLVRSTDLPTLAWALACTIYPNGYPLAQPCAVNPDVCQHITNEHLILSKLSWVDRTALTPLQKRHMANRVAKYTVEEIQKYQSEGAMGDGKTVDVSDRLRLVLRIPTVQEYVEAGNRWVNEIIDMVDAAMTRKLSDEQKDELIMRHSHLAALRHYSHWIKRIVLLRENGEEDGIIEDTETLEDSLTALSSDESIVDKFLDSVRQYIDDSTLSLIALPSYTCPKCQEAMTSDEKKHPHLIPLEPNMLFFILRARKLSRGRKS